MKPNQLNNYFAQETDAVLANLESQIEGLSTQEAQKRLAENGYNEISEKAKEPLWMIFLRQFNNPLVYILLVVILVSFGLGKYLDASVILLVVLTNAILGFVQEYKAEKSVEALKGMVVQTAKVMRDGEMMQIPAREVVVGDILVLEEGDKMSSDGRIIKAKNFSVVESALTGEAYPINKNIKILGENTPLGDRLNMVLMSTFVARGEAKAVVTATGNNTEIGKIASDLQTEKRSKSHFEHKIEKLGTQITIIALVGAIINFITASFLSKNQDLAENLQENLLFGISSLVSGIPEGLPAILALILAVGAKNMASKNAIVRVLPATETFGAVSVIASDKTGTLTKNTMTVTNIWLAGGQAFGVTGNGWSEKGEILDANKQLVETSKNDFIAKIVSIAALSNKAKVTLQEDEIYEIIGDPTEAALVVLGQKAEMTKETLANKYSIKDDLPFNSDLKLRATLIEDIAKNNHEILVVGATEQVLDRCNNFVNSAGEIVPIDAVKKAELAKHIATQSGEGMRLLGFAVKESEKVDVVDEEDLENLIFVGYIGIVDPLRPEVVGAVKAAHSAGIRVMMLTGDHKNTALSIGRQIGIVDETKADLGYPLSISEEELSEMEDEEFEEIVKHVNIFARCTPNRKLRILEILQSQGEIVAMTGDGVNDAPALKRANVGVAMGKIGTDVAREAAEVVLADDNFATIVKAVEQGRVIYNNIARSSNVAINRTLAGMGSLFGAILLGSGLPFSSTQLLWLNLVTETIIGVGMAYEHAHGNELNEKPNDLKKGILSKESMPMLAINAILMIILVLVTYAYYLPSGFEVASTSAFLVLYFTQFFNLLNFRSFHESVFKIGIFSNKIINIGIIISVLLQVGVMTIPAVRSVLGFYPIPVVEFLSLFALSSIVLWAGEIYKFVARKS